MKNGINDAVSINTGAPFVLPPGITTGAGGKLVWAYEVNMWKNPVILFTVIKVIALAVGTTGLFVSALVASDSTLADALKVLGGFLVFGFAGMLFLAVLAYLILGLVYGGRYCVLFEMDDRGIRHTQMQKQFEKAQVFALLTTLAAVASKNVSAAGAGVLAGSTQSIYSAFSGVNKLVPLKRHDCIKISGLFARNQIYATPEQFNFVWAYIVQRCPKAKKPVG